MIKKVKNFWPYLLILIVGSLFFFPVLKGYLPFPGDLLVGEYAPYNSNSYFGIAPGGIANKGQGFDIIRMTFPWKEFAIENIKSFQIPSWNPYNFSGTPFMANFQGGVFYPFNLLMILFGMIPGWTMYIVSQPFLALIFTFLYLRQNNLSRQASLFGAIVFSFSSFMVVWLQYGIIGHTIIWLPLVLLLIDKSIKKFTTINLLLLIMSLTSSILAGYIQVAIYLYIFSFTYLIFRIKAENKSLVTSLKYIPIFVFPLLLSSFQLLPTLQLFLQSSRSNFSTEAIRGILIPLQSTITTFVPDFFGNPATRNYWLEGTYIERVTYIGVLPMIFVFFSFFQKKNKNFLFFSFWLVFVYVFVLNTPFGVFINSLHIPFIATGVPTRILFLFSFAGSVLSAYGLDTFLKEKKIMYRPLIVIGLVYLVLWVFVLVAPHYLKYPWISDLAISKKNLIFPSLIFFASLLTLIPFRKYQKIAFVLIIILVFDLFYFFNKITPFSPSQFFYPETKVINRLKTLGEIDRSWGYQSGYIETNFQTHEKIYSAEGYDPLIIKRYMELVTASRNGKFPESVPRSDVNIVQNGGSLRDNVYRKKLIDLLGIKYITYKDNLLPSTFAPKKDIFPEEQYSLIWQDNPWQIYKNNSALERFFIAFDYKVEDDKSILSSIYNNDVDLRKTILLEENPILKVERNAKGEVKLLSYKPDKIKFYVKTNGNGILFLSDNYYPDWQVNIDGSKNKIYRADYSFRAVVIPKGEHTVEFLYNSESFKAGLIISALCFLSIALYVIISLNKRRKDVFN